MSKVKIVIPKVESNIDDALIEGLRYMGTLNELDLKNVDKKFHKPFRKLFQYTKERMKEGGRDRHLSGLVEKILSGEKNAPIWVSDTDARHTIASFNYLFEICNKEGFELEDIKRVGSSIITHDCAYPRTGKVASFDPNLRVSHMQEVAKIFRTFASLINNDYPGFYSKEDIHEICSIVGQHDNPDVQKEGRFLDFNYNPPKEELVWAHREADRLWMIDKAGFALDLMRRLVISNPWYDPAKYLDHVIMIHTSEAERYADDSSCIEYNGKKTIYRTHTGFRIFKEEVDKRAKEYGIEKYLD